jgi:hypothetical protein
MSKDRCCKLDEEFVCGIIRHRSGIDSGELDYSILHNRVRPCLDDIIFEVQCLLDKLIDMRSKTKDYKEDPWDIPKRGHRVCQHCGEVYEE